MIIARKKKGRAPNVVRLRRTKWGQSMFELLVAVFVVGITLTALLGLVTNSIGNTSFSRERTQAAKFTQEAVEWLRSERDSDWGVFKARSSPAGTVYCLQSLSWTSSCGTIANSPFSREVTLINDPADPDLVEARIKTSWQDANGTHESRVTTYFTNWRTR